MPPLRLGSLADCVRDIGVGGGGVLAVLVRRSEGLLDRKPRLDSRVEVCLLNFDTSILRPEVDPEPERGLYAVRLEDPPPSLLLSKEDLRTGSSSSTPIDFGRP